MENANGSDYLGYSLDDITDLFIKFFGENGEGDSGTDNENKCDKGSNTCVMGIATIRILLLEIRFDFGLCTSLETKTKKQRQR